MINSYGKRSLMRVSRRLNDNIKMGVKESGSILSGKGFNRGTLRTCL